MKIAVLGTGVVGRAHAQKLEELGHTVYMGTQDPKKTMAQSKPDAMGNPPFPVWYKDHKEVKLVTMREAAKKGEMVIEALHGQIVVEALKALKTELAGKVLIDLSNALDFSLGMPPSLFVSNTDSLGEQIQKAIPKTKVVKTFNTLSAALQINPHMLAGGDHHVFVSGNDAGAKKQVMELQKSYGWKHIIDLGDITTARGTEMLFPFWIRMMMAKGTPMFNYKIVTE